MYLRMRCCVTGELGDYIDVRTPKEKTNELKTSESNRGIAILSGKVDLQMLGYRSGFNINGVTYNIMDFDFIASDFKTIERLDTPGKIEHDGLKFDLFNRTVIFINGKRVKCTLIDLNLPEEFHNFMTTDAVRLGVCVLDLLSDDDLLLLSLMSKPEYHSNFITADYVKLARDKMVEKGYASQCDYDSLDAEFEFANRMETSSVDISKI